MKPTSNERGKTTELEDERMTKIQETEEDEGRNNRKSEDGSACLFITRVAGRRWEMGDGDGIKILIAC